MICCYILYSQKIDKFYVGMTQESLSTRLEKHNTHGYGTHRYTATTNDWQLFLSIECQTNKQAIAIERHIKKMKSKVYIQNLKSYPEMIQKLLTKYPST